MDNMKNIRVCGDLDPVLQLCGELSRDIQLVTQASSKTTKSDGTVIQNHCAIVDERLIRKSLL